MARTSGGVTGIAWEIGVLAGLVEAGVDLMKADAVVGTSAGAFVGVAVGCGYDLGTLAAAQSEALSDEISVAASPDTIGAWFSAFGAGDAEAVGAAFGEIAKANPEPVSIQARRTVVEGRLVTREWPVTLRITAVDADTGVLHVFDRTSGVALVDAVAASGAVPGVWPLVRIDGRSWIDGGMVSSANARLADGYQRVIVLAPMPTGYGAIPGVGEDVAVMQERASVCLLSPDEESVLAIGPNPYDPDRRGPAAEAGKLQGLRMAPTVKAMW
ncbi:MAG TPA: patatin-like phospholipase family protein [Acidimicrobiales bacterium]|nr:patatin-like phospholipase family protein [Acidimicrobiales bacterium]